jgi:beta-lactamase class C
MQFRTIAAVATACCVLGTSIGAGRAAVPQDVLRRAVDEAVAAVMTRNEIPGLVVGITTGGRHIVFNYGVAALDTRKPIDDGTLFEIGSVSKAFTATLASWAELGGHLAWSDAVANFLPSLRGTPFGAVRLINLATHTPGGLPLQVPATVTNDDQLMSYLREWRPTCAPETCRTYSNVSIGLLGLIAAQSLHQDFTTLAQDRLFPALGLSSTYIDVPGSRLADYAQGHTREGKPIRMKQGMLWAEAYGIKTTATDLLRFLDANIGPVDLAEDVQRAIALTHAGYFKAGVLTQDLIWEQYPVPVDLKTLLEGNSAQMSLNATPATAIVPPLSPRTEVLINKTGSTNGFGAYAMFVPSRRIGIVILANKNYPIEDRVSLAYRILSVVDAGETRQ